MKLKPDTVMNTVSLVASCILSMENLEILIIVRCFLLICFHTSVWEIMSFVGIRPTLGNFLD